jgi:hypothetical protein
MDKQEEKWINQMLGYGIAYSYDMISLEAAKTFMLRNIKEIKRSYYDELRIALRSAYTFPNPEKCREIERMVGKE